MKFGYTTLACPNWTLEEAFNRGAEYGYEGLELGWIDDQFPAPDVIQRHLPRLKSLSETSGCRMVAIGSYVQLARDEPAERANAVAEAKVLLNLAGELGVEFVRIFAGWLATNPSEEWAVDVVCESLDQLTEVAASANVKLALETHDVFKSSARVRHALDRVDSPYVVALWDLLHPCRVDESPATVWENLAGRVGYVHVKDARKNGAATGWSPVPLGTGEVPVEEAVQTLKQGGFDGFFVVEVEKQNQPNLPEPEVSLPADLATLREYLGDVA